MPAWIVVIRNRKPGDPEGNLVEAETVEDARSLLREVLSEDAYARVDLIPWKVEGKLNVANKQIIAERKNLETR